MEKMGSFFPSIHSAHAEEDVWLSNGFSGLRETHVQIIACTDFREINEKHMCSIESDFESSSARQPPAHSMRAYTLAVENIN